MVKKFLGNIGKAIAISFLLELLLFNYYHWCSVRNQEVGIDEYMVSYGEGLEKQGNGTYLITDADQSELIISGIDMHVSNIHLNIFSNVNAISQIELFADEDGFRDYRILGTATVVPGVIESEYVTLHLNGKTNIMKLVFKDEGQIIAPANIRLNCVQPFHISKWRMLIVCVIALFILFFRPNSEIYRIRLCNETTPSRRRAGSVIIIAVMMVNIFIIAWISQVIRPDQTLSQGSPNVFRIYEEYADDLIEGNIALSRKAPEFLARMDNPYDPADRLIQSEKAGEEFEMDYAYYNGNYYCYFGVAPALLFFVPYKLITGSSLATWDMISIAGICFVVSVFCLVYVIFRRYLKQTNVGIYILSSLLLLYGSAVVYLVDYPIVYSVPIISALLFGTIGLTFWIDSVKEKNVNKAQLVAGSVFIALCLATRPQFVLVACLAIPIFWEETLRQRLFFSWKGLGNTVCITLPFILIGMAVMYYNALRFSSPFDFGANYNLTGNDMTKRGFVFDRFPLGIFLYLLQPISASAEFPFLENVNMVNDYHGFTSMEGMSGGIFFRNILLCMCGVLLIKRFYREKRSLKMLAAVSFILGIIIMLADIQMSGNTERYFSDFSFFMALASIIVIGCIDEKAEQKGIGDIYRCVVQWGTAYCVGWNIWSIFIVDRFASLIHLNPVLFYTVKSMLPFY